MVTRTPTESQFIHGLFRHAVTRYKQTRGKVATDKFINYSVDNIVTFYMLDCVLHVKCCNRLCQRYIKRGKLMNK